MESAVAFVSLFLGLVLGPQEVEVTVAETIARVEILIDGTPCAEMVAPPWKSLCDFGQLSPRHLEAVGFGATGNEVGRAELWLNLPRPPADARLVLLDYRDGKPRAGRVTWNLVTGEPLRHLRVLFDGRELIAESLESDLSGEDGSSAASSSWSASDGRTFELPEHDRDQLHFLRVELEFADNVSASAELTFGGFYADRVNSELTAVPVELPEKGARLPDLETLQAWIEGPAGPLPVVAAEKGLADIVVVMGGSAPRILTRMLLELPPTRRPIYLSLDKDERLFIGSPWPVVKGAETAQPYSLFPYTRGLTSREGGYLWLLSRVRMRRGKRDAQRLADCLAVAGVTASSRNRRRAVVLLLGPRDSDDASQLSPDQVRGYFEDLGMPLRVFSLGGSYPEWGDVIDVSSLSRLRNAVVSLKKDLARQRTLWVEGTHLPQTLEELADASVTRGVVRAR